ncbi:DUF1330 domain-containing protein [Sulfitobacter sp.]|uniref:DUF1330 domain-containing protein n=1 Tax=Sulfitobacter sp. TaxID=1903071 RepID=UPI0039E70938
MTDYLDPDRAQFDAFKALDRDTPLNMLNLVRLRDVAAYPADHALASDGLTGADAYQNYGAASGPVLADVGGSIVWRGQFETTLIGPRDEAWDIMFIAQYPNAHAFLQMISDPRYKLAVVHRQAAVITSRLIRSGPLPLTDEFA